MSGQEIAFRHDLAGVPPLNPGRFTKLRMPALEQLARNWAGLESAFAMCLNVARLRNEPEMARRLRANIGNIGPAQAFYLYRECGETAEALKLVTDHIVPRLAPNQPVAPLLYDAIRLAHETDPALLRVFLEAIARITPDFRMSASGHAFFYRAGLEAFRSEAPAIFGTEATQENTGADSRICGITKIRNEGALVSHCVENLLTFCDFVVIFDHESTDGAPDAAVARFGGDRVEIVRQPNMSVFDEKIIYDLLFARARAKGATHLALLDADERVSPALSARAVMQSYARKLRPGESLAVLLRESFDDRFMDTTRFSTLNDCTRFMPHYRDMLYCDDGAAFHRNLPLHNPWLPEGFPSVRRFVMEQDQGLLHFDKSNIANAFIKTDWYFVKELFQYRTPLFLTLSRYLPSCIMANFTLDEPPPEDFLAHPPSEDYRRLARSQLADIKKIAEHIPEEARFLLNFDYSP